MERDREKNTRIYRGVYSPSGYSLKTLSASPSFNLCNHHQAGLKEGDEVLMGKVKGSTGGNTKVVG